MELQFVKYNATGNDFIVVYDPKKEFLRPLQEKASTLCHRHFGVGADGILMINESSSQDFAITILNSDASLAEMCANGARSCLHYYCHHTLKKNEGTLSFASPGGEFSGKVQGDVVQLQMKALPDELDVDLSDLEYPFAKALNTGVPHLVLECNDLDALDINKAAKPLRDDKRFPKGVNVNFFQKYSANTIGIRTYERGVEGETLSCGTGILATAYALKMENGVESLTFQAKGGEVSTDMSEKSLSYEGSVNAVFKGTLSL